MEILKSEDGTIALSDKSEPAAIQAQLEMSKKAFKKAIGNLYRQKKISIGTESIDLL